tara:strand:+ start:9609 stop:11012 length:1404 start_codon:yes stop_codon:yes gene_type:complete
MDNQTKFWTAYKNSFEKGNIYFLHLVIGIVLLSCVKDRNFKTPVIVCSDDIKVNTTYKIVKELYVDQTLQIQDDLIIEGYVISSDEAGNFFSVLYFQNTPENPTEGFEIEVDVRDSHLIYPIGTKIFIKLKGLYLGKSKEVYKIGGVFSSFGNLSVGRLPALIVNQHILVSCDERASLKPTEISLQESIDPYVGTLVLLNNVEVSQEEIGFSYAVEGEETKRMLIDCNDNEIGLLNSGYSNFQAKIVPEGSGTISGLLLKEGDDYFLVIRNENDISFVNERCEDVVDEFTSTSFFISELADPNNNSGARFVELYNSSTESLSLKGWRLRRYTNANLEISSSIDLTGYEVLGESTFVIAPNASEFEIVYGFSPDLGVGTSSAADSNGDDNLVLVDPFGTVIDVFGSIGEDGSGTNHEFEDGRAFRNLTIQQANAIYTFSEWQIYNDTGASGTTNQPKNAPDDFNPGVR